MTHGGDMTEGTDHSSGAALWSAEGALEAGLTDSSRVRPLRPRRALDCKGNRTTLHWARSQKKLMMA